jgi:hypothetical protein
MVAMVILSYILFGKPLKQQRCGSTARALSRAHELHTKKGGNFKFMGIRDADSNEGFVSHEDFVELLRDKTC